MSAGGKDRVHPDRKVTKSDRSVLAQEYFTRMGYRWQQLERVVNEYAQMLWRVLVDE
jgi:hypothetical protein